MESIIQKVTVSFIVVVCLVTIGSSCSTSQLDFDLTTSGDKAVSKTDNFKYKEWTQISEGVEFKQMQADAALGSELFSIVKFSPANNNLQIAVDTDNPLTVSEWRSKLGATVVINASFFDEEFNLTTQTIVEGKVNGPLLSGKTAKASTTDGKRWIIAATQDMAIKDYEYSIQSYPMLISNAVALVDDSSDDIAQRSVVAMDEDGLMYLIIAETGMVTLQDVDDLILEDLDIPVTTALNLDGGTSTGISILGADIVYENSSAVVPSVLYLP
ncbi:MAG: phosphodiester glycosidase family protein [bacterium]|nr:phosphodiester glycosidase family protein [bacterium]